MEFTLNNLEEGWLKGVTWSAQASTIIIQAENSAGQQISIVFKNICFLKMLASRVHIGADDSEIWRIEEIQNSPLIQSIHKENDVYWLRQHFGDKYERVSSVADPDELHHIILLSDYMDLELLCTEFEVNKVKVRPQNDSVLCATMRTGKPIRNAK